MAEAYIYDAVRTPRGRGKPDGSLHEVSSLGLANTALTAIRERNNLSGPEVDDAGDVRVVHRGAPAGAAIVQMAIRRPGEAEALEVFQRRREPGPDRKCQHRVEHVPRQKIAGKAEEPFHEGCGLGRPSEGGAIADGFCRHPVSAPVIRAKS